MRPRMTNPMMQSVAAIARRKANAGGGGTPTQVVTNGPFGTLRNDYGDWVGWRFSIAASQTITSLSRWALAANTGTHTVKIWTDGGSELATADVDCAPPASDGWVDVAITPLVLSAGTYRIASKTVGADQWYGTSSSYTVASGFTLIEAIYGTTYADTADAASSIFVPVGFIFEA